MKPLHHCTSAIGNQTNTIEFGTSIGKQCQKEGAIHNCVVAESPRAEVYRVNH